MENIRVALNNKSLIGNLKIVHDERRPKEASLKNKALDKAFKNKSSKVI